MAETYMIRMGDPATSMIIDVEGVRYKFRKPKKRWLMMTASALSGEGGIAEQANSYALVEDVLLRCMTDEGSSHLKARLEDPDDVVDVEHIMEILQHLMGGAAGIPPTQLSDSPSSQKQEEPTSQGGVSQTESVDPM